MHLHKDTGKRRCRRSKSLLFSLAVCESTVSFAEGVNGVTLVKSKSLIDMMRSKDGEKL